MTFKRDIRNVAKMKYKLFTPLRSRKKILSASQKRSLHAHSFEIITFHLDGSICFSLPYSFTTQMCVLYVCIAIPVSFFSTSSKCSYTVYNLLGPNFVLKIWISSILLYILELFYFHCWMFSMVWTYYRLFSPSDNPCLLLDS